MEESDFSSRTVCESASDYSQRPEYHTLRRKVQLVELDLSYSRQTRVVGLTNISMRMLKTVFCYLEKMIKRVYFG